MKKLPYSSPEGAPAVGPYTPAVGAGDVVFTSGHLPLDREGALVGATAAEQARQALDNLRLTLEAAGVTTADVVKTNVFLQDMADFAAVNEVYGEYFAAPYPARSCVQVARLPKDALVEIEAVAVR